MSLKTLHGMDVETNLEELHEPGDVTCAYSSHISRDGRDFRNCLRNPKPALNVEPVMLQVR